MAYTTIDKPDLYFNTVLYTGTGSTSNSVTGIGFQPDWLWLKSRSNAYPHFIYDVVRTNRSALFSNNTNAEDTGASNQMTSFDSDGFTVVDSGGSIGTNASGSTFVAWNWLASNTTASNTDGSITSTVSANTTAGFSIVSYTGNGTDNATVGHKLGQKPDCLIVKNRSAAHGWGFWSKSLGAETQQLGLNLTNAVFTDDVFKSSNSTTVTLGVDTWSNNNAENYVMYCFAEKKGFSKFSSYVGNGSTNGSFCYLGFRPAFVIIKRTDSTGYSWATYDSTRYPENKSTIPALWSNLSDAEGSYSTIDFLSNGFKIRDTSATINASGGSYIYMAFAENPFVTSTGIPTVAR